MEMEIEKQNKQMFYNEKIELNAKPMSKISRAKL